MESGERAATGSRHCSSSVEHRRNSTVDSQNRLDDLRPTLMDRAHSEFLNQVVVKGLRAFSDQMPPFHAELVERGLTPEEAAAFDVWLHSWFIADTQHITSIDKVATAERQKFDFILRMAHRGGAGALLGDEPRVVECGRGSLHR